jgi:hypothetical protein
VIRTSNAVEFVQGPPLEFLDGFARGSPNYSRANPRNKHGHESILA